MNKDKHLRTLHSKGENKSRIAFLLISLLRCTVFSVISFIEGPKSIWSSYFLLFLLLELKDTDTFDYFILMIKVNILILVRVIKEMTTMQSTGENHIQQIR